MHIQELEDLQDLGQLVLEAYRLGKSIPSLEGIERYQEALDRLWAAAEQYEQGRAAAEAARAAQPPITVEGLGMVVLVDLDELRGLGPQVYNAQDLREAMGRMAARNSRQTEQAAIDAILGSSDTQQEEGQDNGRQA
jgi:hypothetical protein